MERIKYDFGQGSTTILFSLREKIFFNVANQETREELHKIYGGKQYYWSCSGLSGAGYLEPVENDLISLPIYRDGIKHLSEAYPTKVNGVEMMVPVSIGRQNETRGLRERRPKLPKSPIVLIVDVNGYRSDSIMTFVDNTETMLSVLRGGKLSDDYVQTWEFKHLHGTISVKWWSDENLSSQKPRLPYKFSEFVKLFFPLKIEEAKNYWTFISEPESLIRKCLKLAKTTQDGDVRCGLFGLPVEKISELSSRFQSGSFFSWSAGDWFSTKNFIFRRNGEKIYAVYECKRNELSSRFSEDLIEYEREFSVFDWYSRPAEEWISEMRKSAFDKAKDDFINTTRWSIEEQTQKIKELLENNSDVMFFIADSLATGNCLPGTERFMEEFDIKEPISAKQLLEHKKFKEMLKNSRFLSVVLRKLFNPNEEAPEVPNEEALDSVE